MGTGYDPRAAALAPAPTALPAVPGERLAAPALRHRFQSPPQWAPELPGDRFRLSERPPLPAAVLVPLVAHPEPSVLLTQRTAHLDQHAGQIAFPGGRTDSKDRSAIDTALRETEEEVGLPRERIEVIGQLPVYETGTGFRVTPVVGLVDPGFSLRLQAFEVDEAFEVPLAFLMDPANHQRRVVEVAGVSRSFFAMPYRHAEREREYFIWGATAAMLRNLYRFLVA
ncbi:MAG: CoA pyrophosphatase [Burkholderiales bacterium]|nr:MAG: CoA pyrophosphatase [Burkholderiales bacterium]